MSRSPPWSGKQLQGTGEATVCSFFDAIRYLAHVEILISFYGCRLNRRSIADNSTTGHYIRTASLILISVAILTYPCSLNKTRFSTDLWFRAALRLLTHGQGDYDSAIRYCLFGGRYHQTGEAPPELAKHSLQSTLFKHLSSYKSKTPQTV
jgi:hypothetical protein